VFLSCGCGRCIIVIIVVVVVAAAVVVVVVVVDDDLDDNNNNNYGTLLRTITIYSDKSHTKIIRKLNKKDLNQPLRTTNKNIEKHNHYHKTP